MCREQLEGHRRVIPRAALPSATHRATPTPREPRLPGGRKCSMTNTPNPCGKARSKHPHMSARIKRSGFNSTRCQPCTRKSKKKGSCRLSLQREMGGGGSPFNGQIQATTGVTHPAQLCCERETSHVSREQMEFSQGIAAFKKGKTCRFGWNVCRKVI